MCLNESYTKVWVEKNFFDTFPIKNGSKKKILYRQCFYTLL